VFEVTSLLFHDPWELNILVNTGPSLHRQLIVTWSFVPEMFIFLEIEKIFLGTKH
jgi:hypothetical protein